MPHFGLTEEQVEFRKWLHEFAEREIRPVAAEYDESEDFPWPVLKKASEIGLYSLDFWIQTASDETGLSMPIALEEICWGCAGIGLCLFGSGLPLAAIANAGTPEQVMKWGPMMFGTAEDLKLGAFAVTEPQAGSDVSSLRTTAKRERDGWLLNGRKVFITNGGIADVHVVVATVDPNLGHRGQASFIVEKGTPGFTVARPLKKQGWLSSDTAELMFTDCRIPAGNLLGEENKGFYALMKNLQNERIVRGAQAMGEASKALELALEWTTERKAFGRTLWENQAIRHRLAMRAAQVEAAKALIYETAWRDARGQQVTREVSMIKALCGTLVNEVIYDCLQFHGGMGYVRETAIERMARDARVQSIGGGATEVMLEEIAKRLV